MKNNNIKKLESQEKRSTCYTLEVEINSENFTFFSRKMRFYLIHYENYYKF